MREKLGKVTAVVIVIFVYMLQEVGQPILDIHSGNLAAAHHRVHDCSILGSIYGLHKYREGVATLTYILAMLSVFFDFYRYAFAESF